MAAAAICQDVSTNVVGWLWDVIYVGISKVLYQAIGDTLPMR
jgi:hypothetical protein